MTKARQLADLGNAYDDGAITGSNMIINGSMAVSQRGDYTSATVSTNNQYYLDRWKVARTGVSGTITHTGSWQRLEATSSGSGTYRARQAFEIQDISRFAGKTVTMSARVKSNSSNARLLISADGWLSGSGNSVHSGNGQEETLTLTVTLPSSISTSSTADVGFDGALSANVSIQSGDYVEFTEVQLEVGDTATPFEHGKSYGEELAKCQRYYEKIIDGSNQSLCMMSYYGTTSVYGSISFKVEKRTSPSLIYSGAADSFRIIRSGGDDYFTTLLIQEESTTGAWLYNTSQVSGTQGQCFPSGSRLSSAYLAFDAEL